MAPRSFIVLTSSRSGSTQLVQFINQIDRCLCLGEIFRKNPKEQPAKLFEIFADPVAAQDLFTNSRAEFWSGLPNVYAAMNWIGAKVFYGHCPGDSIWERILGPQTAVIHLWRPNVFDSYVSSQIAQRSGVYNQRMDGQERIATPLPRIEFDVDSYLDFRTKRQKEFLKHRRILKSHVKTIEIQYDLIAKPAEVSVLLGAFFETPANLTQTLRKQVTETPDQFILNIDEARPFLNDLLDQNFSVSNGRALRPKRR